VQQWSLPAAAISAINERKSVRFLMTDTAATLPG